MSSLAAATNGRVFYTGYKFWFASSCYLGEYLQLPWVEKLCLIICKDQKELLLLLAKFVKNNTCCIAYVNNIGDQCGGWMVACHEKRLNNHSW